MTEIIGVKFKNSGKSYYFSPKGRKIPVGKKVIVETVKGVECGEVAMSNRLVEDDKIIPPLKEILREATEQDLRTLEQNKIRENQAFNICLDKIAEHKLSMNLIDVESTFDNNKLLFYFTAENRVDFRELVKDLASVFKTRIELRQIGVRDEAKLLGGLGVCGNQFCCKRFLAEFQPVSIKMAKEQGLSLNPTKISGTCGRLMCCLKYEQNSYEELLKTTPKVGAYVKTPEFKGYVEDVNLLTGKLKVKPENSEESAVYLDKADVTLIKDGKLRFDREELNALKGLED